jgi:predicted Zn-dependent protease
VRLDIIDGRLGEPLRRMAGLVRPLAAEVSLAEGRAVAAQAILQALVSETPADADSWVALAAVHQAQGRMSDAQAAAEQAVRLQPAWPHATLTLGAILETQGKSTEARVKYEALLKIDPDAVDVKKRLAR